MGKAKRGLTHFKSCLFCVVSCKGKVRRPGRTYFSPIKSTSAKRNWSLALGEDFTTESNSNRDAVASEYFHHSGNVGGGKGEKTHLFHATYDSENQVVRDL